MLRWIVLVVLLANIFAAFWFYSLREFRQITPAIGTVPGQVPGIFLLGELSETVMPESKVCLLYGAFSGLPQVLMVREALRKSDVSGVLVVKDKGSGADYWVYLPEEEFGGDPVRTLHELQANNINSFVYGPGEFEGAISIGAFSAREAAEEQARRLERLGYRAEIHEMPRLVRQYWLGLTEQDLAKVVSFDWQKEAGQKITTRKVEMPCERVASPREFP